MTQIYEYDGASHIRHPWDQVIAGYVKQLDMGIMVELSIIIIIYNIIRLPTVKYPILYLDVSFLGLLQFSVSPVWPDWKLEFVLMSKNYMLLSHWNTQAVSLIYGSHFVALCHEGQIMRAAS
jgi:hypothetical protein